MTSKTWSAGTVIDSTWLQDVDNTVYKGITPTGATTRRTLALQAADSLVVKDFGAIGDGVTDDTTAFTNATTSGATIFVPYTSSFYSLTSLSAGARALLWGPGIIKVNNTITPISSQPAINSTSNAARGVFRTAQTPSSNTTNGSVGYGADYTQTIRSGGFGQYGNVLHEYLVTAAIPSTQFDVGTTSWATSTNLTGGSIFGYWTGSNTPGPAETFSGGSAIGHEINTGNRWGDFGIQSDVTGTRYTVGLQLVPDVVPTTDTISYNVTLSSGTPGIVNWTAHNLPANTPLYFGGTGTLPAAVTAGTVYYVLAAGLGANSFEIATTPGGAALNFATSSTGSITAIPSFPGSFASMKGPSVRGHKWWIGELVRYNTLMPLGYAYQIAGSAAATYDVPQALIKVLGYWVDGIDFSGGSYSGKALKFGAGQTAGTATAGGGQAALATVLGYLIMDVAGTTVKIPYFSN